ncbi:MAG TPA: PQQ-binding-like beta-propeller repeat protein [Candidatus Acidoferrales bacterium]|nr:PQQ-binding-like beta-propeller repeat protein [Candidatus Acidoferrales bacterium]
MKTSVFSIAALLLACLWLSPIANAQVSGEQVFQKYCSRCHDHATDRVPPRSALQKLSRERILRTLDFGMMMSVAYPMRRDERAAVANFLGTTAGEVKLPASAMCPAGGAPLTGSAIGTWNGWSPSGNNTRYQTANQAGFAIGQVPQLKLKWAFGFADDITAFAEPSVLKGTLFVGSAGGVVQALDAKTGCVYWTFQANGPVRSGILAVANGSSYSLLFGDLIGWFYSLDAKTGKQLWIHRVDEHEATRLTATPVEHEGLVFVPAASWEETRSIDPNYECCTFRGSVTALHVKDGTVAWKTYTVDTPKRTGTNSVGAPQFGPSGAPVWSSPTIDAKRGVMYVTTGDNYSYPDSPTSDAVMAVNLKTGKIEWTTQTLPKDVFTSACRNGGPNCPPDRGPDYDFGSSALLLRAASGKDVLVAGQKSGIVYALDPDKKGEILWQTRVGLGSTNGGVEWGMASDGQLVFAAVSDAAPQPGKLGTASPVGNVDFDQDKGGGITALRIADGSKAWFAPPHKCDPPKPGCSPAQPGALTAIPGVIFSGAIDGHIRAFGAEDGKVLWDFDTAVNYTTVNGVAAHGGSLDGAGPVVAGGMVYVNSGYPRNGGMPGNVLLAFGADDNK